MDEPKIEFRCSQCDCLLRVAEVHRGKWLSCPTCASEMQVPEESESPFDVDEAEVNWNPQPVPVGEIFRDTWAIYVENLWMLLGAALIDLLMYLCGLLLILVPAIVSGVALQAAQVPPPLIVLGVVLMALLGVITLVNVMACRHARFFLKVARGEPVAFSEAIDLRPSTVTFLPIAFCLLVGIGLMIMVIPGVYIYLTLWPYLWVWADHQAPDRPVDAFPLSKELTKRNIRPSIAISLVVLVGSFFGQAEIFTGTFARLLKAVAYLKMSGQEVGLHRRQDQA